MFVVFLPAGAGPKTLGGALAVMVAGFIGLFAILGAALYGSYQRDTIQAYQIFSMASHEVRMMLKHFPDAHEKISSKLLLYAGSVPTVSVGPKNTIQLPYGGRLEASATADAITFAGVWFNPGFVAKRYCHTLMEDEAKNLGEGYRISGNCDNPAKAELIVQYDREV